MRPLKALRNLGRNAPLLLTSSTRMLHEDPLHFLTQLVRRTPHGLRDVLQRLPLPKKPGSTARTLALLLTDRRDALREELISSPSTKPLAHRLRIQADVTPLNGGPTNDQARYAWEHGNITAALVLASGHLKERLVAQLRVLTPGMTLSIAPSPRHAHSPTGTIRVLHALTNSLPWTQSGYSIRSHQVLQAQARVGLEVQAVTRPAYPIIIGRPQAGLSDVIDGITYRRILPRRLPAYEDARVGLHARSVAHIAREWDASVLHTTTHYVNGVAVDAAARALGLPWVYEMRGELEKTWVARHAPEDQEALYASERFSLMRRRETEMALRANAVVALSEVQKRSLCERGVPAEKIVVIPNAVDEALLDRSVDTSESRQKLGLAEGFWVGSISSLVDYEGLDDLLRAVAVLFSQGVDIRCALVGDGVARASLLDLAKDLGIFDRVVFPGRVSTDDALDWYCALDVMVIPRKDTAVTRTVTPMKGLQAMALGIPQVVSDLPALVEVGSGAGQGLTVPSEDPIALAAALRRLSADPQLRGQLGKAARVEASKRTWRANGERYLALYQELLHS